MHSAERTPRAERSLAQAERSALLAIARRSIELGVRGEHLRVDALAHTPALRELRASFVTLHRGGALVGCIGSLEAASPLVEEVARVARDAALRDPRFPPLRDDGLAELEIHISVLSPLEPLPAGSREELIAVLRPRIDGLLLRQGALRGTFLPSVWDSLPDPRDFVSELERKAGLLPEAWSRPVECLRYTTEEWS